MSLIDFSIMIGQWVAIAGSIVLLHHFTPLPFWAAALIPIPVGAVVGVFLGVGFGLAVDFVFRKWKRVR